jgi:hypothetical protein
MGLKKQAEFKCVMGLKKQAEFKCVILKPQNLPPFVNFHPGRFFPAIPKPYVTQMAGFSNAFYY